MDHFTQDDVIDRALVEFGRVLKNRHALLRQARKEYHRNDMPIPPEAYANADLLVMEYFRHLCIAAEWMPELYQWRRTQSSFSDEYHYRELLRTLPLDEFNRLILGKWTPPEDKS